MQNRVMLLILLCALCAAGVLSAAEDNGESVMRPIQPWESMILGVVEGVTEYLPVSSTGHLILASHYLGLSKFADDEATGDTTLLKAPALDAFEIVIQAGAILAVLGLYRVRVSAMIQGLLGRSREGLHLLTTLAIAFLPAAIVGLLFRDMIKAYLFRPVTVAAALAAGGAFMIVVERLWYRQGDPGTRVSEVTQLTYRKAFIIGLFQCMALCPGMSRSMVTIVGGILVGLDMVAAAEFSFLLALPTLGGATVYEGMKEYEGLTQETSLLTLVIGIAVSGLVAALSVKALVSWLTGHGLVSFGYYRLVIATIVLVVFLT